MRHSMSKDTAFNAKTTPRHTFLCSDSHCFPPGDPRILCAKHGYPITGKSFICLHFPCTCFQIWKRVAPFACIGGKRKARLFPLPKKPAWFSRTILIVFKEILAVSDLYFCAESVFDRFNSNLWISEIFDCETCSPTTRPRQPIEMSKYGRSRNSLKV